MKKSVAFALLLGIAALSAGPAFSANFQTSVQTQVEVNDLFRIVPSQTLLNYGVLSPGQTGSNVQTFLNVQTNHNVAWTLSIFAFDLTGPNSSSIPATSITAFTNGGTPAGHAFGPLTPFSLGGPQLIYTAQPGEFATGATGLNIEFVSFINVPGSALPGVYNGAIDLLLADSF
jgi:hypothetical protein